MASKVKALQQWCKKQVEGYDGVNITNMNSSWRDGLAFCALIHRYHPELIDFASLDKNNVYENNKLAFDTGTTLGIEAYLDPEDMVNMRVPDRLSIITYVSQFCNLFGKQKPSKNMGTLSTKTKVSPIPVSSSSPPASSLPPAPPSSSSPSSLSPSSTTLTTPLQSTNQSNNNGIFSNNFTTKNTKYSRGGKVSGTKMAVQKGDVCCICHKKIYLLERHLDNNQMYHRHCFRNKQTFDIERIHRDSDSMFKSKDGKENNPHVTTTQDHKSNSNKRNHESNGDGKDDIESIKSSRNDNNEGGVEGREDLFSKKNRVDRSMPHAVSSNISLNDFFYDNSSLCIYTKKSDVTSIMVSATTPIFSTLTRSSSTDSSKTLTPSITADYSENNGILTQLNTTQPLTHPPTLNNQPIYTQPFDNNLSTQYNHNTNVGIKPSSSFSDSMIELSQATNNHTNTYLNIRDEMGKAHDNKNHYSQNSLKKSSTSTPNYPTTHQNATNSALEKNNTLNAFRNIYMVSPTNGLSQTTTEKADDKLNKRQIISSINNNPDQHGLAETSLTSVSSLDFNCMEMSGNVPLTAAGGTTASQRFSNNEECYQGGREVNVCGYTNSSPKEHGGVGSFYGVSDVCCSSGGSCSDCGGSDVGVVGASGVSNRGGDKVIHLKSTDNGGNTDLRIGDGYESEYNIDDGSYKVETEDVNNNVDTFNRGYFHSGIVGARVLLSTNSCNRNVNVGRNDFSSRISSAGTMLNQTEKTRPLNSQNFEASKSDKKSSNSRGAVTCNGIYEGKGKPRKGFVKKETVISSHHISYERADKSNKNQISSAFNAQPRLERSSEFSTVNSMYERNREKITGKVDSMLTKPKQKPIMHKHTVAEKTTKQSPQSDISMSMHGPTKCTNGSVFLVGTENQKNKPAGNDRPLRPRIERKSSKSKYIEKDKKPELNLEPSNKSQPRSPSEGKESFFTTLQSPEDLDSKVLENDTDNQLKEMTEINIKDDLSETFKIPSGKSGSDYTNDKTQQQPKSSTTNLKTLLSEQQEGRQNPVKVLEPVPLPRLQMGKLSEKMSEIPLTTSDYSLGNPIKESGNKDDTYSPLVQSIRDLINDHDKDSLILCGEQSNYSLHHASNPSYPQGSQEATKPKLENENFEKLDWHQSGQSSRFVLNAGERMKSPGEGLKKGPPRPPPPKVIYEPKRHYNDYEEKKEEEAKVKSKSFLLRVGSSSKASNNRKSDLQSGLSSISLGSERTSLNTKQLIKPNSKFFLRLADDESDDDDDDFPTLPSAVAPRVKRKISTERKKEKNDLEELKCQTGPEQDHQTTLRRKQWSLKLEESKMKDLLEQQMNEFQIMEIQQQTHQQTILQQQLQKLQDKLEEIQIQQKQTEFLITSQSSSYNHPNSPFSNPLATETSNLSFQTCVTTTGINSSSELSQKSIKPPRPAPISNHLEGSNLVSPTSNSPSSKHLHTSTTQTSLTTLYLPQNATKFRQSFLPASTALPKLPQNQNATQSIQTSRQIPKTAPRLSPSTPQLSLLPTTIPSRPSTQPLLTTTHRKKIISAPQLKDYLSFDHSTEPPIENAFTPEFLTDPYLYERAKMNLISKLAEIDNRLKTLEAEGRDLEDIIRGDDDDEDINMKRWFELIEQRNDLLRDETEFVYRYRQLEYERDQVLVDEELRFLLLIPESEKTMLEKEREDMLIVRKVDLVCLRNNIIDKQEVDRIRYLEEDEDLIKNKEEALNTNNN